MFNTTKLFFLGLICLPFISCKKDVADENRVTPEVTTEKVSASDAVTASYFPYSNGSQMTYVDSTLDGESTVTKSAVMIAGDTTIDGKLFSKTSAKDSRSFKYYNATEGVTTLVSYKGKDKVTTTVLKANEPVGATWKDIFTNGGIPTTYQWTMVAKDLNRTVQGIAYANVIQVHLSGYADVPGRGKVAFANSDYYYAPNVGLIENISYNTTTGKTELRRVLQKS